MQELFTVVPPSEAFRTLKATIAPLRVAEDIQVRFAAGRIAGCDICAPEPLPGFTRATMDGFAVRSVDTVGASESAPAYLRIAGEARTGTMPTRTVERGEATRIHTGAMLPPGSDAVVMVEQTTVSGSDVEILRGVAPGENVFGADEDVACGETVIPAGRPLRAAEIGVLCALGITTVSVTQRPRVAVVSTGDEVVRPEARPGPGQIRDVNGPAVSALIAEAGGVPIPGGIAPDDEQALEGALRAALADADALVLSAGSSVSSRDLTGRVVERLGPPGVLVHGVALWPGKPTVLAVCEGKPVVGLPGNPMSALVVAWRFVRPLVRFLAGEPVADDGFDEWGNEAILTHNVPSRSGREDYVAATVRRDGDGILHATPIYAKSAGIASLARAGALIVVPLDSAGLAAGTRARVVAL